MQAENTELKDLVTDLTEKLSIQCEAQQKFFEELLKELTQNPANTTVSLSKSTVVCPAANQTEETSEKETKE